MGTQLALAALRAAPDKLTPGARLTLVAMASHALDHPTAKGAAGEYFGGHAMLCTDRGLFPSASNLRVVRRYVRELIAAGLVSRELGHSGPTRTALYRLHLEPVGKPVDRARPAHPRRGASQDT